MTPVPTAAALRCAERDDSHSQAAPAIPAIAGATWLELSYTARGVVVGCPACGAQELFEPGLEPVLAHVSSACPIYRAIVTALQRFIDTNEVLG